MKRNEKQLSKAIKKRLEEFKLEYQTGVFLDSFNQVNHNNTLAKMKQGKVTGIVVSGVVFDLTDSVLQEQIQALINECENVHLPFRSAASNAFHNVLHDLNEMIEDEPYKKAQTLSDLISEATEPHKHYSAKYIYELLKK
jgi:hypothetical protein